MRDLIPHILSPHRLVRVDGITYKVKQNVSWELREEAQALSNSLIHKYRFEKIIRRAQVEPTLERLGFAISDIPALQERIKSLKKDLYRRFPDLIAQRPYRQELYGAKKEFGNLQAEIGLLDTHSLEFYAEKMGLFFQIKNTIVKCPRSLREDYSFIEKVYFELLRQTVGLEDLRRLARNDHWRSFWSVRKAAIFRHFPLTDEQLALSSFSKMYDNIYNHHEAPPQAVIDDDDMLDGWLLIEQEGRNRKKEPSYGHKIDSSQEIFVMAENQDHANSIYKMNNPEQRAVQNVRKRQLASQGRLEFGQLADVQRNIQHATR